MGSIDLVDVSLLGYVRSQETRNKIKNCRVCLIRIFILILGERYIGETYLNIIVHNRNNDMGARKYCSASIACRRRKRESPTATVRDRPCREGLVSFGEVGLAGEVRPVRYGEERIAAAAKQGFTSALVPRANVPKNAPRNIEVIGVTRLGEALDQVF